MLLVEPFTYAPRLGYPLYITAKRYWTPVLEPNALDPNSLTLILLHSTSFHKEAWEPTVEHIFEVAARQQCGVKIREAWLLDCPNHGASAELNEKALLQPPFLDDFTCQKYAEAVHHFLSAGVNHGARVDFRRRKLVGIGHSLGSIALSIVQHIEPLIPFSTMILVEPLFSPAGPEHFSDLREALVKTAYERRDVWPSYENAYTSLKKRDRTSKWHPRILELYVKYALRTHPGSKLSPPYNGVTLACTREQEAAMYRDKDGPTGPLRGLAETCRKIPVHIIFGGNIDLLPKEMQDALTHPSSDRRFASITKIPGAGHLVPQEAPEKLGEAIYDLMKRSRRFPPSAKL